MNEQTFTFPSKSDARVTYTTRIASDGKLLCNCKGWTQRRGTSARHCTHTKEVAKQQSIVERGEFVYLASAQLPKLPTARIVAPARAVPEPPPSKLHYPMLATPMTESLAGAAFDARFADGWALEEKLDGHRVMVRVRRTRRFFEVEAFSRPQRNQTPKPRQLPEAMVEALAAMGEGDYDGELVAPTGKSWDVVVKGAQLIYVVFDILSSDGDVVVGTPYADRRLILLQHLGRLPPEQQSVSTVLSVAPTWKAVQAIWARGGEGAILKRLTSVYQPGSRSPDWLKVKPEHHAELTIIGYEAGKSGPYSAIRLRDAAGIETTVKTLGNRLLADITAAPDAFLGRTIVIQYQERTPAGYYRHGRFDHFKE